MSVKKNIGVAVLASVFGAASGLVSTAWTLMTPSGMTTAAKMADAFNPHKAADAAKIDVELNR